MATTSGEVGQIIVVAGLLLAVVFVGLALVVNSAIYAENIATRSTSDKATCSGLPVQEQLRSDFSTLIDRRNARTTTTNYTRLHTDFESDVESFEAPIQSQCASRGVAVQSALRGTEEGIRLRQTNESRDFTDKNGNWNWTLTNDAPGAGQFAMTLDPTSLYEDDLDTTLATLASEAFGVAFHLDSYGGSGDGVWRVFFYRSALSDDVYVVVETPEQTFADDTLTKVSGLLNQTCTAYGDTVGLRLRAGTFGGSRCSELGFYEDIGPHAVAFENARVKPPLSDDTARARGGYNVLLETTTFNDSAFHTVGNGQPFHHTAIAEMRYDLDVQTTRSTYRVSNTTVVPLANPGTGILRFHPTVERFEITDETSGDPTFTIDWRVFDLDGDLDRVNVYLVHRSDDVVADSASHTAVDAVDERGADTLTDTRLSGDDGDEYLIVVNAVDDEGRTTTDAKTRIAG